MKEKSLKINIPKGYEIDRENSTFECIKFKPVKRYITYEDVCNSILEAGYYTNSYGEIVGSIIHAVNLRTGKNNATNAKQLKRLLALNQLLNIAEYYNRLHPQQNDNLYCISFEHECTYLSGLYYKEYSVPSIVATFNRMEDAQAVIDNPNFREILDMVYKN